MDKWIWISIAIIVFSIAGCCATRNLMFKTAMERGYEIGGAGVSVDFK